eukprot:jgi/Bigna1/145831/aug1.104_g20539
MQQKSLWRVENLTQVEAIEAKKAQERKERREKAAMKARKDRNNDETKSGILTNDKDKKPPSNEVITINIRCSCSSSSILTYLSRVGKNFNASSHNMHRRRRVGVFGLFKQNSPLQSSKGSDEKAGYGTDESNADHENGEDSKATTSCSDKCFAFKRKKCLPWFSPNISNQNDMHNWWKQQYNE